MMLASIAGLFCCAPANAHQKDAESLVGIWLMTKDAVRFPESCSSDQAVQYYSDETYSIWGEGGRWLFKDGELTEWATGIEPLLTDNPPSEIGKKYVSTLRWENRDRFWKSYADGKTVEFRRCPEGSAR